jgi:hypothetical protein
MSETVYWSAPNQQVVREDQSGPGAPPENPDYPLTEEPQPKTEEGGSEFDQMTKEELLAYGQGLGIVPMHQGMTKEEIRAAIDQHQGG